jgi:hypothetical protein
MVLPRGLADTVRGRERSDDSGARVGDTHFHVALQTPDPDTLHSYLSSSRGRNTLTDAIQYAHRRGYRP